MSINLYTKELTASDVANIISCSYARAKRLMESNEIRSFVVATSNKGKNKTWRRTLYKEVLAYHLRD